VIDAHREEPALIEPRWDASVELALERQIGLNWCWAAVAKGIVDHYGGPIRKQCQYATTFLRQHPTCCRGNERTPRCDAPCDIDTVLAHYGLYAAPYHRPVLLETLRRELEKDRPVVALIEFPSSVHAVAITAVDVANRRIGVRDPWTDPQLAHMDAGAFERAYGKNGRWFYTILTRPREEAPLHTKVSFLRDRLLNHDRSVLPVPYRLSEPLDVDAYEADPYRLALGTGLQTADRVAHEHLHLDVLGGRDASLRLDREATAMREDIEARLDRGFELRIVRCFAYKLEALWFTDPSDLSHRTDHYIAVPPVPYYLEAGREYSAAELRDALVEIAPVCIPAIEANRKFIERLDQETVFQVDDPTI
jgi:hypothetical protein